MGADKPSRWWRAAARRPMRNAFANFANRRNTSCWASPGKSVASSARESPGQPPRRSSKNLEELGPDYFAIAQVTGISANEYRRIQASVSGHALLHAGEEIPVAVENAPRLIAAVDALRREAAEAPAPPADTEADAERSFARAGRALRTGLAELDKLRLMPLGVGGRMRLQSAIGETAGKLKLLDMQVKV